MEYWGDVLIVIASPTKMRRFEEWLKEYTRYKVEINTMYSRGYFDWFWELLGYKITHSCWVSEGTLEEWDEINKIRDRIMNDDFQDW